MFATWPERSTRRWADDGQANGGALVSVMGWWEKWRRLKSPERSALVAAAWRLLVVQLLLMMLGVARTERLLTGRRRGLAAEFDRCYWAQRIQALQRVAGRMPGVRCLARSLALCWWMQRMGVAAQMRMGVQLADARAHGHAWVEIDGKPVGDHPERLTGYQDLQRPDPNGWG